MLESMLNAFRAPDIRRRLLFVLGILVVYRALAHVLIPGINPAMLDLQVAGQRLLRPVVALLGRRHPADVDRWTRAEPVHQRHDHHADPAVDDPVAAGPEPRGRVRPEQDHQLLALAVRAAGRPPGLRHPGLPPGHRAVSASPPTRRPFSFEKYESLTHDPGSHGRLGPADVAGRADHREGHRQRHQLHHLRRHRVADPGHRRSVPATARTGSSCSSSASSAWSSSS